MKRPWISLSLFVLGLALPPPRAGAAPPSDDAGESSPLAHQESRALHEFLGTVEAWQLEEAKAQLDDLEGLEHQLGTGVLAVYEARYPEAEQALAGLVAELGLADGSAPLDPFANRAAHYLAVARGAQVALGEAIVVRSQDDRFEAVFADPKDRVLAPYLFRAMEAAYEELGEEIGVRPDHPIRFEIYDEPGKLALVTPLTLDNIYTTGTVGICKYRRIMMITPRVMVYGYGWLDTAVHEYVHYLVTLRTHNEAPVWMQEGLAKLFESRWRVEGPEPLDPPIRHLLHDALESNELVTLEQMHPSIAMLPSQEMAALAYAEAETMLGLLGEERGDAGLGALMDQVGRGVDAKVAFADAWGSDWDSFFLHWKQVMRERTSGAERGPSEGPKAKFRDDPNAAAGEDPSLQGDVFSHLGGGRARQHARLGVLLTLRGHDEAAIIEYEKARAADRKFRNDPKLVRRLGELYLRLDRASEALPLLEIAAEAEPENPNLAAALGRARLRTGDRAGARAALDMALRQNPFIPAIHCDLAELAEDPLELAREKAQCTE